MAVSFRVGVPFTSAPSDPQVLNPGTDPAADAVLIIASGISGTDGGSALTGSALVSDSFGGTWTEEYMQVWGTRRRIQVWVNDDWTTAAGAVSIDFANNQDRAVGMLIAEGVDGTFTEGPNAGAASGTNWTPTLAAGHGGYVVVIQMEAETSITTPSGWVKQAQVTSSLGLRSLAVFTHVGQPGDLTPSFTWTGGSNGYTGWTAYLEAAAGGAPDPLVSAFMFAA